MYKKSFALTFGILLFVSVLSDMGHAGNEISVYTTSFDSMTLGVTTIPADPGHDGWCNAASTDPEYGEIQETIANTGRALHQYAGDANESGYQKIDQRSITPPDLSTHPIVTLSTDFYCHTSDLSKTNPYTALLSVNGGPHPGFTILGFGLHGGNGIAKSVTGINVALAYFNGVDNNESVPLTVGQGLSWDGWHTITLIINQADDTYVSVTVDEQTQDLSGYALPRSVDGGVWLRGELMEMIMAQIIPEDFPGESTSDDVYWDNMRLTVNRQAQPHTCDGDFDIDGDVDGLDLAELAGDLGLLDLAEFAWNFGKVGCFGPLAF